ncbi:hypothetical protein VWX97_19775 [Phaeobacter sp. JH18-32]|uniref:hypothetical protein n=1 Tax=Phaeobacter TaxID=302485 RepID=UPI003A83BEE7
MVEKTGKTAPADMGDDALHELDPAALEAAELVLDDLFAEARTAAPMALPPALERAILSDAQATQAAILQRSVPVEDLAAEPADMRDRIFAGLRDLLAGLGGWPALGGLSVAGAAGLWIGLAPPSFLPDPVSLAGLEMSEDALPDDSYDLAMVLSEEME